MPDLYEAQIDGLDLEIETLDDEITKAIVKHEYPHRHGALLEDMGQHARTVKIKCHFWDDGGDHNTYAAHEQLLNYLDLMQTGELVHPKHGPMRGCIESMAIRHDDSERWAEIDITFVEGLIEDADDTAHEDVEGAAEAAYLDSVEEQKASFGQDMLDAIGAEANAILATVLDPLKPLMEQYEWVSGTARKYLQGVESFVNRLATTLDTVANPSSSLLALASYGANLPGLVIGALSRCAERYGISIGGSASPARQISSLATWSDQLVADASDVNVTQAGQPGPGGSAPTVESRDFGKTARLGTAAYTALQTAYIYKADEETRRLRRRAESRPAFDTLGNYTPPEYTAADPQPMTMQELENSLAQVRARLQTAVDLDRGADSLKRLALTLMSHISTVKLEMDRVTMVAIDSPLPLHLICLHHGLPYQAAERLLDINNHIRNPNEVSGKVAIYAD
jgi:prophage DNA circulation protein